MSHALRGDGRRADVVLAPGRVSFVLEFVASAVHMSDNAPLGYNARAWRADPGQGRHWARPAQYNFLHDKKGYKPSALTSSH